MKHVDIYTDGACRGNPGRGGWGAILVYGSYEKELSGGSPETTNNRMELLAAIEGLSALKEPCEVELYSDSKYLVDAHNEGWVESWRAHGWRRGKDELKNPDLWQRFLRIYRRHHVRFVWVKGHAETVENNRCDQLAVAAASGATLLEDVGYQPE